MNRHIYQSISLIFIIVLAIGLTGCLPTEDDRMRAAEDAQTAELTRIHGAEVKQLILGYYAAIDTVEYRTDINVRSQFIMGPVLDSQRQLSGPSSYVMRFRDVSEIHVLEYNSQKIKAVGCGSFAFNHTDETGQIKELPLIPFMNIFIFKLDDGRWKLYTGYTFRDPKSDTRDWAYVSEEEKEEIGDLEMYIDRFHPCG